MLEGMGFDRMVVSGKKKCAVWHYHFDVVADTLANALVVFSVIHMVSKRSTDRFFLDTKLV